jgi:hypothetical protein
VAELLRSVGVALPFVGAGLSLIGGLLALAMLRRGGMRQRSDRRMAIGITLLIAIVVGGIVAVFTALIGSAWGGGNWIPVLPIAAGVFGLPVAIIVTGAGLAGYALAVRLRPAGDVAWAAFAGQAVLGLACLLAAELATTAQEMDAAAAIERDQAAVAANSEGLHLTVTSVETTLDAAGMVQRVEMHLQLVSDTDVAIDSIPGKVNYPLFVLSRTRSDPNTEMQVEAPAGSGQRLAPGQPVAYDIVFDTDVSGVPTRGAPGSWFLEVRFAGTNGINYAVEREVDLRSAT